jgi:hypothetical protein
MTGEKEKNIQDNGIIIKCMVRVYMNGKIGDVMKGITKMG